MGCCPPTIFLLSLESGTNLPPGSPWFARSTDLGARYSCTWAWASTAHLAQPWKFDLRVIFIIPFKLRSRTLLIEQLHPYRSLFCNACLSRWTYCQPSSDILLFLSSCAFATWLSIPWSGREPYSFRQEQCRVLHFSEVGQVVDFGSKILSACFANDSFSVKATAAHIAFDAPSRSAVNAFFAAALKAGGRIHGEPAIRDHETGYYSAAVLDFDDNSIEAMHRVRANQSDINKQDKRVLSWQEDVARSTVDTTSQAEKQTSRVIVNNISTPTTVITRNPPQAKEEGEMSAKALVGTLLGAAAGAAVAYAMAKGEAQSVSAPAAQTITYQTVETSNPPRAQSTLGSQRSHGQSSPPYASRSALKELEYPQAPSTAGRSQARHSLTSPRLLPGTASVGKHIASTLIDTFIPPSEIRYSPPRASATSCIDSAVGCPSAHDRRAPSLAASQHSEVSRAPSTVKTVTHTEPKISPSTSVITEIKVARDIPLPSTALASQHSRASATTQRQSRDTKSELASVAPSDSVSQAASRRSMASKRSSRHGNSRSGLRAVKGTNGSCASERTAREARSRSG